MEPLEVYSCHSPEDELFLFSYAEACAEAIFDNTLTQRQTPRSVSARSLGQGFIFICPKIKEINQ